MFMDTHKRPSKKEAVHQTPSQVKYGKQKNKHEADKDHPSETNEFLSRKRSS
jgi:hypothetical protein